MSFHPLSLVGYFFIDTIVSLSGTNFSIQMMITPMMVMTMKIVLTICEHTLSASFTHFHSARLKTHISQLLEVPETK